MAYIERLIDEIFAAIQRNGCWVKAHRRRSTAPISPPVKRTDSISTPANLRRVEETEGVTVKVEERSFAHVQQTSSSQQPAVPVSSSSTSTTGFPTNYAPPPDQGVKYVPPNMPDPPNVLRGAAGNFPWYVVITSRRPGIYASW